MRFTTSQKWSNAPTTMELARATLLAGKEQARALASSLDSRERLDVARGFTALVISSYWKQIQTKDRGSWEIHSLPYGLRIDAVPASAADLAQSMGEAASELPAIEAGYLIGVVYTAMLPEQVRARLGAYYTPPALCDRLLDIASEAGVNWTTCRVLDPACGGGAFLSPVAQRMAIHLSDHAPRDVVSSISQRLRGFEVDAFSAWTSQVFLEATLLGICKLAGMRLPGVVRVCDSLEQRVDGNRFDLVVGNPPYGRITLKSELRERYKRSLFGHANLYGVFTDLALEFAAPEGVIAYVTPTSFLAGEYFKSLRGLLGHDAPPVSIDFIVERRGVFEDVLQETLLATYKRGASRRKGKVRFIAPGAYGSVAIQAVGSFQLPSTPQSPWIVQRTKKQTGLVNQMRRMPHRLADYGYRVSTGPLVWNRHKQSLRDCPGKERYPLIWAEAVRSDGWFEFRADKRNHKPYFEPRPEERWVVTDEPCVLLQRTTAKEQHRRLIAAELPHTFIAKHRAVVIENHLNMIRPINGAPKVSAAALSALLNTEIVDQAFRCINGSVAVSAYELEALPLPCPEETAEIERLVKRQAKRETINRAAQSLYKTESR